MLDVNIRPYRDGDTEPVLEAVIESKQELSRWMPWCHNDYGRKDAEAWVRSRPQAWEDNQEWSFVIVDQGDNLLGTCGFHHLDLHNGTCELGYWVRTKEAKKGIATKAVNVARKWIFNERGLHRLELLMSVNNLASQRVAEKAGATCEAVLRQRLWLANERQDAVLFAILNL